MILHPPFLISARLCPALKIGTATLSLTNSGQDRGRGMAQFAIDAQGGQTLLEASHVYSGVGGFSSYVDAFETFLSFLAAFAEACQHGEGGENASLFPVELREWARENADDIGSAQCDLMDEEGNLMNNLITP
jgi:hypothetical protein